MAPCADVALARWISSSRRLLSSSRWTTSSADLRCWIMSCSSFLQQGLLFFDELQPVPVGPLRHARPWLVSQLSQLLLNIGDSEKERGGRERSEWTENLMWTHFTIANSINSLRLNTWWDNCSELQLNSIWNEWVGNENTTEVVCNISPELWGNNHHFVLASKNWQKKKRLALLNNICQYSTVPHSLPSLTFSPLEKKSFLGRYFLKWKSASAQLLNFTQMKKMELH